MPFWTTTSVSVWSQAVYAARMCSREVLCENIVQKAVGGCFLHVGVTAETTFTNDHYGGARRLWLVRRGNPASGCILPCSRCSMGAATPTFRSIRGDQYHVVKKNKIVGLLAATRAAMNTHFDMKIFRLPCSGEWELGLSASRPRIMIKPDDLTRHRSGWSITTLRDITAGLTNGLYAVEDEAVGVFASCMDW